MVVKYNWKTFDQCNEEALKYNPKISENLKDDSDYCIRGKLLCPDTGLYLGKIEAECYLLEKTLKRKGVLNGN